MHTVLLYLLGCFLLAIIGAVSAGFVALICWMLKRTNVQRETAIAVLGLIGILFVMTGGWVESRVVIGLGLLLCGWIGLVFFAIPAAIAVQVWSSLQNLFSRTK